MNVSRTDRGEYRCVARNRVGNDTSNAADLDVQCKYSILLSMSLEMMSSILLWWMFNVSSAVNFC